MGTMGSFSRARIARLGAPALLLAIAATGIFSAQPAQAKNDFANGFEDQLGRIAAYEAVSFGKFVISGGAIHPHYRPAVHRHRRHHHHRGPRWARRHRTERDRSRFESVRYREEPCDDDRRSVVYERVEHRQHGDERLVTRKVKYSDGTKIVTEKRIRY